MVAGPVKFVFSVTDLKKSIPGTEALDSLSGEELLAELGCILGDMAKDSTVSVEGDVVTIEPNPIAVSNSTEAARLHERAGKRARSGHFEKAAGIYQRVLELDPTRQDSRRELAMVLIEMGNPSESVDVLLDVLKMNPLDHQALIILGNHYARVERDLATATRFFERAGEIAPNDPVVQNSIAAALFEQKKSAEALQAFDRALELDPGFANAHYGKSMVLMTDGHFVQALGCLDQLFREGNFEDARVQTMLRAARDNYRKLANIVANDKASESFKAAENLKAEAAAESGFPVVVEEKELSGTLCAVTKMAWKYRRNYHEIHLQSQLPAEMLRHHVLAHEAWHVLLESRAQKAGTNRWFVTEDARIEATVDSMKSDIRRIARSAGHDESELRDLAGRVLRDGLSLLYNGPLDMLIETRLAAVPEMREAQFCSLLLQAHNASSVGLNKKSRSIMPGLLLKLNDALNGAMALFIDELFSGATAFFPQYNDTSYAKLAESVRELCRRQADAPGTEYDLVDAVAEMLGLSNAYTWKRDTGEFEVVEKLSARNAAGVTNPSLLKQKSPEAVPLLLAALRRFDRIDEESIKKLVLETALLGQEGISYTDTVKTHQLKALPGESLSGLEVMCLLYAGMKRLAPSETNLGMDLNEEFAMALELYHSETER